MDYKHKDFLDWRDIPEEECCKKCGGRGIILYPSTSTWRGGIGGAMMTNDVCDKCWGSGNEKKPWLNLRLLRKKK